MRPTGCRPLKADQFTMLIQRDTSGANIHETRLEETRSIRIWSHKILAFIAASVVHDPHYTQYYAQVDIHGLLVWQCTTTSHGVSTTVLCTVKYEAAFRRND